LLGLVGSVLDLGALAANETQQNLRKVRAVLKRKFGWRSSIDSITEPTFDSVAPKQRSVSVKRLVADSRALRCGMRWAVWKC
jgi:hypothetical protein